MIGSSPADPARVTEPVVAAIDGLIVGATTSFALSVMAVLGTLVAFDDPFHAIAHGSLPALMTLVIVARAIQLLRQRRHRQSAHRQPGDEVWTRARAVAPFNARLAEVLSVAVPLAWLVGGMAVVVRHAPDFDGLAAGIGVWLPLSAGLWICAAFAWTDACRDTIAGGLDESHRKFREYWRDVAGR